MINFLSHIFSVSFICGFLFIAGAVVLYYFPPKKRSAWLAYRSARAVRSQEHWDFAQRFAALQIIKASVVMILISFSGYFFEMSNIVSVIGSVFIILAWERYVKNTTDKAIVRRFSEIKN